MAEITIVPNEWQSFQHYKDRSPAWIKLHKKILFENRLWFELPIASKALAPSLWLIASEYQGGKICITLDDLAFRLRMSTKDILTGLKPLIELKFFVLEHDASGVLAGCLPRGEERRGEESIRGEEEESANASALLPLLPQWFDGHPNLILQRIMPGLLSCKSGGKIVFTPESFSEDPMLKVCERLAKSAPDMDAIDRFIQSLVDYCAGKKSPPYSVPSRVLNDWLDKREADWLKLKQARGNARSGETLQEKHDRLIAEIGGGQ